MLEFTILMFALGFFFGRLASMEEVSNLTLYLKAVMRKIAEEEIQLLPSDIENAKGNKLTIDKWKSGILSTEVIDITCNNKEEY